MSPDIEWRIGEEAAEETVIKTPARSPARWRKLVVLLIVGAGIGLGVLYRSIPEPPPTPIAPTAALTVLTPTPLPLTTAIQNDVARLAGSAGAAGQEITFDAGLSLMPQAYADWYASLQNATGPWDASSAKVTAEIKAMGTLPNGTVWINVVQRRNGHPFQQTRFYRLQNNRWQWILPEQSFWGNDQFITPPGSSGFMSEVTTTSNFVVSFPSGDNFPSGRFARVQAELCDRLHCPRDTQSGNYLPLGAPIHLEVYPLLSQTFVTHTQAGLLIQLPSARVTGYYEDALVPGDPIDAMAYETLLEPLVRAASGDYDRWETDQGGQLFLDAISNWERLHIALDHHPAESFFTGPIGGLTRPPSPLSNVTAQAYYTRLLDMHPLVPLNALWNWQRNEDRLFGTLTGYAIDQANSVIAFINDRYGDAGVIKFLNALGPAHSLEEAVEQALAVSYSSFLVEWEKWTGTRS